MRNAFSLKVQLPEAPVPLPEEAHRGTEAMQPQ
jgi:hypothetical protein